MDSIKNHALFFLVFQDEEGDRGGSSDSIDEDFLMLDLKKSSILGSTRCPNKMLDEYS